MLRFLALLMVLGGLSAEMLAQRGGRDARGYYREFQSQNRRITVKNIRYLESVVRSDDPRRIVKYREMVLEQLRESKRDLERVGAYEDDDVLYREYMSALELYINAFEKNFDKAEQLTENKFESYENLQKYYEAQNRAEIEMIDAAYKIEKAEDYFAKTYDVDLRRDKEDRAMLDKLDLLAVYTRELTLAFFRVDAQMRHFFKAIENDNTDTLNNIITDLRKALIQSKGEVEDLPEFDGKDWLKEQLSAYLEEISQAVDEDIRPLADKLSNKFLPEDEYKDAKSDYERIKEWHQGEVDDFFETKNEVVERYLPEG